MFRVDNPHTKPLAFWEWLIAEVRAREPDVIFLAEAFTRRAMMRALAKVGFNQSYTYFTWKNSRHELSEYVTELAHSGMQYYYRPNFFVNTPDILTEYLQHGGPPPSPPVWCWAPRCRPATASTPATSISRTGRCPRDRRSTWTPRSTRSSTRALDGPLLPLVARLNSIRREHPALQRLENVSFLDTENDALIAYAKQQRRKTLLVVVNLDPH